MADDAGEAKTVQHYVCANCGRAITSLGVAGGFCVQGNIYVADPASRGGLVGNNIDAGPDGGIAAVRETVLCRACFCGALGLAELAKRAEEPRPFRGLNGGWRRMC